MLNRRLKLLYPVLFCFSVVFWSSQALSAVKKILRSKADFGATYIQETQNLRVRTARVALADYKLLAKDFPYLAQRSDESDPQWRARIDQWIVDQTAFISIENAHQIQVNTPIAITDEQKIAYRPKGYGRAFVIPVSCGDQICGLIDSKGTGVAPGMTPSLVPAKRDGLATLGEITREYLYEKLVEMIFRKEGDLFDTVGSYAVVDFGFDLKHADGTQSRAGYILRQSHIRAIGHNSSLSISKSIKIEKLLRKYGITSSGETAKGNFVYANGQILDSLVDPSVKGDPFDYVNIQGTNSTQRTEVIDFGAYIALETFERDLRNPEALSEVLLKKGSPEFVNPDPQMRVPLEQWGDFGVHDPKTDRPFIWAHELADAFAKGHADQRAFLNHQNNMLGPVRTRLGLP